MKKENEFTWDIKETGILDIHGNPINGYKEIKRNDNDEHIAVMKNSYTPMTTKQFSETANAVADVVGSNNIKFQDWDSRKSGQHVITAQILLDKPFEIAGSKMEGYLTLGVGFDGSRSFFVGSTKNYLRCTNQFGNIIKNFTSRLTKNNLIRVEEIIKELKTFEEYELTLEENFRKFQEVKVDEKIINEAIARLVKMTDQERVDKNLISTQKLNKIDDIMASVRTECSELGYNAFALFNSVTHYSTHVMNSRGNEYFGNMLGAKAEFNKTGYDFCVELLS